MKCLGASCSSREFRPPPGRPEMPLPRPWTTEIPEEPDREDWISPRFPIPGLGEVFFDFSTFISFYNSVKHVAVWEEYQTLFWKYSFSFFNIIYSTLHLRVGSDGNKQFIRSKST